MIGKLSRSQKVMPIILGVIGSIGVGVTTYLAIKATPKAIARLEEAKVEKGEELTNIEKVKEVGAVYIPTLISGATTITCIIGSTILNQKNQACLASAYALVDSSFKQYRSTLIDLHGKEIDEEVICAIARKHCDFHFIDLDTPDAKFLFYEPESDTYLEKYEREIMDAEYHLNRNFAMRGSACLNEFLQFLGVSEIEGGDEIGWNMAGGYCWIDFEHDEKKDKHGKPYYVISAVFSPDELDEY